MKNERQIGAEAFLERVKNLSVSERVALKRSLGKTISAASADAKLAFYHARFVNHSETDDYEDRELPYFICACGLCFMERLDTPAIDFIKNLKRLSLKSPDGIRAKLAALLDTPMSQHELFAQKMGLLLRHMKSEGLNVEYAGLLTDLQDLRVNRGKIQRKWSREYFMNYEEEKENVD